MPKRKQWFILAYDITNPKRLRKTHYFLKKHGIPLQNSVFLIHKAPSSFHHLLQGLRKRIHKTEDDVRFYPVKTPNSIWAAGKQAGSIPGFHPTNQEKIHRHRSIFSRLFKPAA